jgi:hypothetical protein
VVPSNSDFTKVYFEFISVGINLKSLMNKITNSIVNILCFFLGFTLHACNAETVGERKAEAGGAYFAAITWAHSIKNSKCGSLISISSRWTDVEKARREVRLTIEKYATKEEVLQFIDYTNRREVTIKQEFASLYAKLPNESCQAAINDFWQKFDKSVRDWEAVR